MAEILEYSSRGRIIVIVNVFFLLIGTASVALRLFTRTILRPGLVGPEDGLLLASLVRSNYITEDMQQLPVSSG